MTAVLDPAVWRALLALLLGAACATDLRARRIPNALVLAVLALGLARAALTSATGAAGPLAPGIAAAALGVGAGLLAWLPLYALGVLGAGDVKLFAAAAAWLGVHGVVPASLYAALAGGVLGLAWVAARALRDPRLALALPASLVRPTGTGETRVPYALAVAAGVLAAAWGASP